jgi:hypothetical protein
MLQKNTMLEAKRTIVIRKYVIAYESGLTPIWTPVAGNRFRLLALDVTLTGAATTAVAGACQVDIRDGAVTQLFSWTPYVNNAVIVGTGTYIDKTIIFADNGWLSAAINNVLNVNLGVALATGVVAVSAFGTEEV